MIRSIFYWMLHLLKYVVSILIIGGVVGFLGVILLDTCIVFDNKGWELWKKGISIGVRYFGVWAGGFAIVLCFMKAHKKNKINLDH